MAAAFTDKLWAAAAAVLRVPGRATNAAKLEHALCLLLGYLAIKKVVTVGPRQLWADTLATVLRNVRKLPGVSGAVAKEQEEILGKIKAMVLGDGKDAEPPNKALPSAGLSADDIITKLTTYRSKEKKFLGGRGMGGIYHLDNNDLTRLQTEAFKIYNCSNALYPGLFPAVRRFEAEVVRMVCTMLNGDENSCGTLSSGGTESVLLACLAYREWGRTKGITRPEIVACVSAHAALDKAAHYFDIKLVHVPHDADFRMDVAATRKAINGNTVAIYASAPTFPHGVVDDMEALGELAQARGIGLHVDNCLGGFMLSFLQRQGLMTRPFDFKVPGVTSMTCDVHKYGLAAKGASCVLYRSAALRRHQYTAVANWSGGLYCTAAMQGSRSGAMMAVAWSTMMYMGSNGYDEFFKKLGAVHARLVKEIPTIEGLRLQGVPDACVVSFTSDDFNIYVLADELAKRGWEVPRLQRPACVHFCVGEVCLRACQDDATKTVADQYLEDLRECAAICMATKDEHGKAKEGMAGIYGMAGSLPDRTIITDLLSSYLDCLYLLE